MMNTSPLIQMDALRTGLKQMVLSECNVDGVVPENVSDHDPVIGGTGALKLDSLDAVEIVAALEKNFGFRLENVGAARKIFKSFALMSEYVAKNAQDEKIDAFVARFGREKI